MAEIPFSFLECLEAIYRLARDWAAVSLDSLGKRLGLNKAMVTEKVLGLQGMGLVETKPSNRVRLPPEGRRIAVGLVRKHRLLERFLIDVLELSWEEVHGEASRLTPALSDRVGDRLPRGAGGARARPPPPTPSPPGAGAFQPDPPPPLHRLKPGTSGIISRIEKEEPELLKYLASLGLLPQTKVEVEEGAPFGGPVLVRVGSSRYALGRKVAAKILVKET